MTKFNTHLDHEVRLVGQILADSADLSRALTAGISSEHFSDLACGQIFGAACDLLRARRPVTVDGVYQWLDDHGRLHLVGGVPGFAKRSTLSGTSANFANDLDRLVAAQALRLVARHVRAVLEIAEGSDRGDLTKRFDSIVPHLRAAQEAGSPATVRDLASIAEAAAVELESDKPRGIAGPFSAWDRAAGALRPGELAVLAARPGLGKTALALQHVMACLNTGRPCAMFSLEMTGEELCGRLARQSVDARADQHVLAGWIRSNLAGSRLLTIYDGAAGATLAQIESRARLHAAHPRGLGLIVIDYLQLIAPAADLRREHRERQVASITRALKLLANELRVPVLLLAQLNRESEREERRPRLTDLRESGAIEQDADAVWFLHVEPSASQPSDADRVTVILSQAKRRAGPPNVGLPLSFHRPAVKFTVQENHAVEPGASHF